MARAEADGRACKHSLTQSREETPGAEWFFEGKNLKSMNAGWKIKTGADTERSTYGSFKTHLRGEADTPMAAYPCLFHLILSIFLPPACSFSLAPSHAVSLGRMLDN